MVQCRFDSNNSDLQAKPALREPYLHIDIVLIEMNALDEADLSCIQRHDYR